MIDRPYGRRRTELVLIRLFGGNRPALKSFRRAACFMMFSRVSRTNLPKESWLHPLSRCGASADERSYVGNQMRWRPGSSATQAKGAVSSRDYSVSLDLRGLTLTGFREAAGLMLRGIPALTGVTAGSGSLKKTRQPGVSWSLFLIMQAVTRSTSGMSELHSRNASSLQAACCSGV
jgi:hypothetical protein